MDIRVVEIFVVLLLANYVGLRGTAASGDISFSMTNATKRTYLNFIRALRDELSTGTSKVESITVLKHSVPDSQRFIRVDLSNYDDKTITVAIDVVNVYVVAYLAGQKSFFLQDIPAAAASTLFRNTTNSTLPFTGSYVDLERAAGRSREKIDLGPDDLDNAITRLYNHESNKSVAASLIVIIQMVSEAARFEVIAYRVATRFNSQGERSFKPDLIMLSLENHWSALSSAIQTSLNGVFKSSVTIHLIKIDSARREEITNGLSLMLYRCNVSRGNKNPFVAGEMYDENCIIVNRTTHMSGRDGLCVDVRDGNVTDGNPIQLWPCAEQSINQRWNFQTDDTIRWMDKCMTSSGYSPGNYVMIYNCTTTAMPDANKWSLSNDGSVINPHSGLVLTAQAATQGTTLTVETNIFAATQAWTQGDDVKPLVAAIVGYNNDLCIQAGNNGTVWLEDCVDEKQEQLWALFSDSTIRVNSNHSLCVTSDGYSSMDVIIILECQGLAKQRWMFKTDGTILNPKANLVMDVSLKHIILYPSNGNATQHWLLLF